MGLSILFLIFFSINTANAYDSVENNYEITYSPKTGWALMGIGCGVFVASIPCIIVGQVQRKKALKIYNEQCADQTPLTFSIQSSSNGLGLAMSC